MCIVDCASGKMCGRSCSIKVALLCKKRQFGRAHVLLSHCSPNLTSVILSIACTFWRRKEVPAEISPGTSLLKNGTSAAAACYVKALPRSGLNNVINLHAAASPTFTHSPIQARRNRWLYFFPPAVCSEILLVWISLLDLRIVFAVPVCVIDCERKYAPLR
jgi:hypothetical protein